MWWYIGLRWALCHWLAAEATQQIVIPALSVCILILSSLKGVVKVFSLLIPQQRQALIGLKLGLIFRVGGRINIFNRGIDGYGRVWIKIKEIGSTSTDIKRLVKVFLRLITVPYWRRFAILSLRSALPQQAKF